MASHNADLATGFGEQARDLLERHGPRVFGRQVRADKRAIGDWKIAGHDGGMESFGVGGGMLGKGADLLIIDDPITGKEALSPTERENLYQWWLSTARNRLNPGGKGAIILMQQRLHTDDLAGRLMAKFPGRWELCTLRAQAEADDPLGRAVDEWLWPWGFPVADYEELKQGDAWYWDTSYQQRPTPKGGGMIQLAWIEDNAVHYIPRDVDARVRFWDCAATENGGDWTVGVLVSRKGDHYYIEDVVRVQHASGKRDTLIKETCRADNEKYPFGVVTWREQEPGSAGKDIAALFSKLLRPYPSNTKRSSGSKSDRADGLAKAFGIGEVHVYRGPKKDAADWPWYAAASYELSTFPAAKHDDVVDACSGAFNVLAATDGDREPAYFDASVGGEIEAFAGVVAGEVTF